MTNEVKEAREMLDYMIKVRRYLHKYPGEGFDNRHTMDFIRARLSESGIKSENVGRCGLCALIGDEKKPCILLRADTDGLRTREKTGLPFASQNGIMQLCGHDLHTAQLLGTAKILKRREKSLGFCVKLMFQSNEEGLSGAKDMIKNGILKNPTPRTAFMLHVITASELLTGTVIIPGVGEISSYADFFNINIIGRASHGANPWEGRDPIFSACSIVNALSHINSRELAITEKAVITIGSIHGGDAPNAVPQKVNIKGSLRTDSEELQRRLKKRIGVIGTHTARAFGTRAVTEFTAGCPSLVNSGELARSVYPLLKNVLGKEYVINERHGAGFGSEDFAHISEKVPSLMLALCAGSKKDGYKYPLHHPKVDFDEEAMVNGCAVLSAIASGLTF